MKSIKITGFCLVAMTMLVVSMVAAGTASAAPHWLVCLKENTGTTTTKWNSSQCTTAAPSGGWEWSELKNTELPVVTHGTLTLEDEISSGTTVAVTCSGNDTGRITGPKTGKVETITGITCAKGENCGTLDKNAEPVHLPWNTELYETEGAIRLAIKSSGAGKPGWEVECTVAGIKKKDECTSEGGNAVLENKATPSLLVLITFSKPNNPKAECSLTKALTGDVLGTIALLLTSGQALAVSK